MVEIERLGHSSFRIRSKDMVIYIDPYEIETDEKADVVLITHPHFDHCSAEDINRIKKPETLVLSPCKKIMIGKKISIDCIRPWPNHQQR